jgi:hypothetical protein
MDLQAMCFARQPRRYSFRFIDYIVFLYIKIFVYVIFKLL